MKSAFTLVTGLLGAATFILLAPRPARRGHALLTLIFAFALFEITLWWNYENSYRYPGLKPFSPAFPLFIGVVLLGHYRTLFGSVRGSRYFVPPSWVHWLPGLFFLLKNASWYLSFAGFHPSNWHQHPVFIHHGFDIGIYLILAQVWGYGLWIYFRYYPTLELDKPLFRRHQLSTGALMALGLVLLVFRQIYVQGWMQPSLHIFFETLMLMLMAVMLGSLPVRSEAFGHTLSETTFNRRKYQHSALNQEAAEQLAERIREVFETEQCYADPDLTLDSFAALMQTNRHYVSQAVNSVFGLSFSDWVGKRRVEEAISLFEKKSPKEMIIKEVGYRVGFSNKTSFTLAFKKWTGMTPSAYREKMTAQGLPSKVIRG